MDEMTNATCQFQPIHYKNIGEDNIESSWYLCIHIDFHLQKKPVFRFLKSTADRGYRFEDIASVPLPISHPFFESSNGCMLKKKMSPIKNH
jgi:hypothetical protein